jgi:hypothetical protein
LSVANISQLGLYVSDGTKLVFFSTSVPVSGGQGAQINISNFNTATSFNGFAVTSEPFLASAARVCLRWHDDGTNVEFYTSLIGTGSAAYSSSDPNWQLFATLSRTAFLTPTQIGWAEDTFQSTQPVVASILHWLVH